MDNQTDPVADSLRAMVASIVDARSACYLAGPLTSSRELLHLNGSDVAHAERVATIERNNRLRMTARASELRAELHIPVINPGILVVPGWEGRDYGNFFRGVVSVFCIEVRFMDGWQYSFGAVAEYMHAQGHGVACLDDGGRAVEPTEAYELVREAAAAYAAAKHPRYMRMSEHVDALGLLGGGGEAWTDR